MTESEQSDDEQFVIEPGSTQHRLLAKLHEVGPQIFYHLMMRVSGTEGELQYGLKILRKEGLVAASHYNAPTSGNAHIYELTNAGGNTIGEMGGVNAQRTGDEESDEENPEKEEYDELLDDEGGIPEGIQADGGIPVMSRKDHHVLLAFATGEYNTYWEIMDRVNGYLTLQSVKNSVSNLVKMGYVESTELEERRLTVDGEREIK